ncbi:MAG TPA: RidA family protein [Thermoanaerobaculia bacterium]|jgi:reactive intermediate/imine deaminase|nr:RidA family protein [Thermoanaerobaculia bacterium]
MATVERFPSLPIGGMNLPFSEAVRVGDLLFISGQLGHYPGKLELVPGGIGAETRQALENLGAVLERRGLGFRDLVKVTCMVADMSEWAAMNEAYVSFFTEGELPARSSFGTSGLALGARIELEAIAVMRG